MKKKLLVAVICAAMVGSLVACGGASNEDSQVPQESSQGETSSGDGISSIKMNIDPKDQVKELCDYSNITVTLAESYEVTQDLIDESVNAIITNYGIGTVEVTDRDTIQEGDMVKVDYTGYWNGEAFENGAAEGAMLTISENSGYIPGFVEGLVGEKVGTTVRKDVTFPDPYTNNPDLSGELTTFEFTIHGIYRTAAIEELTDEAVAEALESTAGITTVEGLVEYVEDYLEQSAASAKASAGIELVKQYVVENSKVEIPEDYLAQRVEEYKASFITDYLSEGDDLETFLQEQYDMTLEEAMEEWKEFEKEQITTELLFGRIAQLEGIEKDEEEYNTFIQGFLSSYSGSFADENALYEYFGNGSKEDGKAYLEQLYITNKAIDVVCEKATINEAAVSDTQSTETQQ